MKFEDAYRHSTDAVHVRYDLKAEIAYAYAKEATSKKNPKRWLWAIPTGLATSAAVLVAVVVGVRSGMVSSGAQAPMMMEGAVSESYEEPKSQALDKKDDFDFPTSDALDTAAYGYDFNSVTEEEPSVPYAAESVQIQADDSVTDGEWTYALNPQDRSVEIAPIYGGTDPMRVELPDKKSDAGTRTASDLLAVGDTLYVFETVESKDETEPQNRAVTVITVYALGDRKTVDVLAELEQPGAFAYAMQTDGRIVVVSSYTDGTDVYSVVSELAGDGGTSFLSQRTLRGTPDSVY